MTKEQANEIKVGIVVLICLVLAFTVIMQLSNWDQWFEPMNKITIKLPYSSGLEGIQAGWPVTIGGVTIGSVQEVRLACEPRDPRHKPDAPEEPGQAAQDSPEQTSDNVRQPDHVVYAFFTFNVPRKYELRDDCKLIPSAQLIGGAGQLTIPDIGREGNIIRDGQIVFRDELDKTDMAEMMEKAQNTLENLERISSDFVEVSGTAREIIVGSKPQIEMIMANAQATSVEMKEGMREIRWNPWRLLHNPTDRELRTQNLLTSARAFSSGASDLNAATGRLEGMLDAYGDNAELATLIKELRASIEKFDQAERQFYKRLGTGN